MCGLCGGHSYDKRWTVTGTQEKPTARASYSVRFGLNQHCHTYLTDGVIEYLSDCSGGFAGKKVPLSPQDIFHS